MDGKTTYQCQKCGRTIELQAGKPPPPKKCSKGGESEWIKPFYFQ